MNNQKIEKECSRCHETFDIVNFKPCRTTKDKLQVWCNTCRRVYALSKYHANKQITNERRRDNYKRNKQIKDVLSEHSNEMLSEDSGES